MLHGAERWCVVFRRKGSFDSCHCACKNHCNNPMWPVSVRISSVEYSDMAIIINIISFVLYFNIHSTQIDYTTALPTIASARDRDVQDTKKNHGGTMFWSLGPGLGSARHWIIAECTRDGIGQSASLKQRTAMLNCIFTEALSTYTCVSYARPASGGPIAVWCRLRYSHGARKTPERSLRKCARLCVWACDLWPPLRRIKIEFQIVLSFTLDEVAMIRTPSSWHVAQINQCQ